MNAKFLGKRGSDELIDSMISYLLNKNRYDDVVKCCRMMYLADKVRAQSSKSDDIRCGWIYYVVECASGEITKEFERAGVVEHKDFIDGIKKSAKIHKEFEADYGIKGLDERYVFLVDEQLEAKFKTKLTKGRFASVFGSSWEFSKFLTVMVAPLLFIAALALVIKDSCTRCLGNSRNDANIVDTDPKEKPIDI